MSRQSIVACVVLVIPSLLLPRQLPAAASREVRETVLFKADPEKEPFLPYMAISADHRHAGYARAKSKLIGTPTWNAVIDGSPGPTYDLVGVNSIAFSSDGSHVAYIAKEDGEFVVLDGTKGPIYDGIGEGQMLLGGKSWIAMAPGPPLLSEDGKHVAYIARKGEKAFVVVDGTKGREFDQVGSLALSPNGARVAYVGRDGSSHVVILNGAEAGPYRWAGNVSFSPDSRRFSYAARSDSGLGVFVDGEPSWSDADTATSVVFSKDGSRYGYMEGKGDRVNVVVGGKVAATCIDAGAIRFSPDGRHFAFAAREAGSCHIVRDGVTGRSYEATYDPTFSPDGEHLAYAAVREQSTIVVVDSTELSKHKEVWGLSFSPNSRQVLYVAKRGEQYAAYVDSEPGPAYDSILTESLRAFVFDAPDRFHYLAFKDNTFRIVEESLPPPASQ